MNILHPDLSWRDFLVCFLAGFFISAGWNLASWLVGKVLR